MRRNVGGSVDASVRYGDGNDDFAKAVRWLERYRGGDQQLLFATAWCVLCDKSSAVGERRAALRAVERAVNDTHEAACLLRRMLDRTVTLFGPGSKTTKDVPRWWESDAGYPVALHCAGDDGVLQADWFREHRSIGASSSSGVAVRDIARNDCRRFDDIPDQKGLFALRAFEPWEIVGAYDGVLVSTKRFDKLCEYSFGGRLEHARYSICTRTIEAETSTNYIVCACDAARSNYTRYINDPSRIDDSRPVLGSEKANCQIVEGRIAGDESGPPSLCVVTTKHVKAGEEFGMLYGEEYWAYQGRMESALRELAGILGVAQKVALV